MAGAAPSQLNQVASAAHNPQPNRPTRPTPKETHMPKFQTQSAAQLLGAEGGHATQFDGLHPWIASKLEEDRSVLASIGFDSTDRLGAAAANVVSAYFAAVEKTGDKAFQMNIPHTRPAYLGAPVDRGEIPGPAMFLVHSRSSAKVATVWVQFHQVNDLGWGDIATATFMLDAIHHGTDAARERLRAVGGAATRFRHICDTTGIAGEYDAEGIAEDF